MSADPEDPNEYLDQCTDATIWKKIILYYASRGNLAAIQSSLSRLIQAPKTKFLTQVFQPDAKPKKNSSLLFLLIQLFINPGNMCVQQGECALITLSFFKQFSDTKLNLLFSTITPKEWQELGFIIRLILDGDCSAISDYLLVILIQHHPDYRKDHFSWHHTLSACVTQQEIPTYIRYLSNSRALALFQKTAAESLHNQALLTDLLDNRSKVFTLSLFAIAVNSNEDISTFRKSILGHNKTSSELKRVCELSSICAQLKDRQAKKYCNLLKDESKHDLYNAKNKSCNKLYSKTMTFIQAYQEENPSKAAKKAAENILSYIDSLSRQKNGNLVTEGLPTAFMNLKIERIRKLLDHYKKPVSCSSPVSTCSIMVRQTPNIIQQPSWKQPGRKGHQARWVPQSAGVTR